MPYLLKVQRAIQFEHGYNKRVKNDKILQTRVV